MTQIMEELVVGVQLVPNPVEQIVAMPMPQTMAQIMVVISCAFTDFSRRFLGTSVRHKCRGCRHPGVRLLG